MLDDIRKRHQPKTMQDRQWCEKDGQDWPCDTRIVLDALDESEVAPYISMYDAAQRNYYREAAHAKALAEALRGQKVWGENELCWCPFEARGHHEEACEQATRALAAYDEADR